MLPKLRGEPTLPIFSCGRLDGTEKVMASGIWWEGFSGFGGLETQTPQPNIEECRTEVGIRGKVLL